jgi:hypothetical protein
MRPDPTDPPLAQGGDETRDMGARVRKLGTHRPIVVEMIDIKTRPRSMPGPEDWKRRP